MRQEIKELSLDREFLVKERSRIKCQLHRLLHKAYNSEYKTKFKDPFGKKSLAYWLTHPLPAGSVAGLAPREKSSGKTFRHIKTTSGNRQLNTAIHRIALSQISRSGNPLAKAYFQRKISEGKTKAQALCCLKRRLVDIIYMMLKHKQPYQEERHAVSPNA